MLRTAALLLSLLFLTAPAASAQARSGFVSVKTAEYDLYAPDQALLDAARPQLDSARARFARYFPGPTPKLHVVVATTRDELSKFDVAALRREVGEVLAWTISTSRAGPGGSVMEMSAQGGGRPQISLLGNLNAAIAPVPGGSGTVVRFAPPVGAGEGVDLRAGDVILGIGGRAKASPSELVAAYEAIASGTTVKLDIERAGSPMTITFTKPSGASRVQITSSPPGGVAPAGAPRGPSGGEPHVLSHEAGHHLLALWARDRIGADTMRQRVRERVPATADGRPAVSYGNPLLPDWLDEAGATLVESAEEQQARRRFIAENPGSVVPLAKLFTVEHPALPGLREMVAAQQRQGGTAQSAGPISFTVRRGLDDMDPAMFYAQSMSVAQFVAEREGVPFLTGLYDAALAGRPLEAVLATATKLPRTVAGLEAEWRAWALK